MKQTAVEQLIELLAHNDIIDHKALNSNERLYKLYIILVKQAKQMEERQTEQIAVEFAEWVLTNEHIDTIWSTPKKQLFQEFLKTKSNDKTTN